MPVPFINIPTGEIREIPSSQIPSDKDACLYPMSFAYDLGPLKDSIRQIGMVNPPILRTQDAGNSFQIITGLRRVMAARDLGFQTIQCRVIQQSQISRRDALLVALHENLACRQFNVIEKALVLGHLTEHFSTQEICDSFMGLLGLAKRAEIYQLYVEIEKKLPLIAKEALAKNRLHLKAATLLLGVDRKSAAILVSYGLNLKLNINQFYEFIDMIIDLSCKHHESIESILQGQKIASIINCNNDNIPQKANKLLKFIRSIRYPTVAQTEEGLRKKIKALSLPGGVRLILPSFLENSEYKLEIRFRNSIELSKSLQELLKSCESLSLAPPLEEALRSRARGQEP